MGAPHPGGRLSTRERSACPPLDRSTWRRTVGERRARLRLTGLLLVSRSQRFRLPRPRHRPPNTASVSQGPRLASREAGLQLSKSALSPGAEVRRDHCCIRLAPCRSFPDQKAWLDSGRFVRPSAGRVALIQERCASTVFWPKADLSARDPRHGSHHATVALTPPDERAYHPLEFRPSIL
jgi:hypothetical protein